MLAPQGMVRQTARAMGTELAVVLPDGRADLAGGVWRLFAHWEAALSRFRADSELSRLNRSAGRPFAASALLFDVVATAVAAAEATGGLYDPTILHALVAAGYDRSFDELPADVPGGPMPGPHPLREGWRAVLLHPVHRTIALAPGVGIDLGGIAKGMAVDAAIDALAAAGVDAALVEAGGDLRVTGLPPGERAWTIAVPTPTATYAVPLVRGALATSGVARRRWQRAGRPAHHLIDPRTAEPARSSAWAVSVGAATCREAEVAAKALFLLDDEARGPWARERGLAALVQRPDGGTEALGAWPRAKQEVTR